MNTNGERMIEFLILNDMKIRKSFWKQLKEDKFTYVVERGDVKSVIDDFVSTEEVEPLINNLKQLNMILPN